MSLNYWIPYLSTFRTKHNIKSLNASRSFGFDAGEYQQEVDSMWCFWISAARVVTWHFHPAVRWDLCKWWVRCFTDGVWFLIKVWWTSVNITMKNLLWKTFLPIFCFLKRSKDDPWMFTCSMVTIFDRLSVVDEMSITVLLRLVFSFGWMRLKYNSYFFLF